MYFKTRMLMPQQRKWLSKQHLFIATLLKIQNRHPTQRHSYTQNKSISQIVRKKRKICERQETHNKTDIQKPRTKVSTTRNESKCWEATKHAEQRLTHVKHTVQQIRKTEKFCENRHTKQTAKSRRSEAKQASVAKRRGRSPQDSQKSVTSTFNNISMPSAYIYYTSNL